MRIDRRTLLASSWAAALFPEAVASAGVDAALERRVDDYLTPYLDRMQFSGVVLIARNDQVLVNKGYGPSDFTTGKPTQVDSMYPIASLSKTFTAAVIIKLAVDGRLSFTDTLDRHLPDFPNAAAITLDQLLRHTSGVGVVEDRDVFLRMMTLDELVVRVATAPPMFAPGSASEYSNEGYILLAKVVERATGQSFEACLEQAFLMPLAMDDTGVDRRPWPQRRATGARAVSESRVAPLEDEEAAVLGASGLISSAPDLLAWMRAIKRGDLIDLRGLAYPYGWGVRRYLDHPLIEQSGLVEGFSTYMAAYEDGHYVVCLSNVQSGLQNRLGPDFAGVLYQGPISRPPCLDSRSDVGRPADAVGSFRNPDIGNPFRIRLKDGQVSTTWGAFPFWRPANLVGVDQFFIAADYTMFTLRRNAAGEVDGLLMQGVEGDGPAPGPPMVFGKIA